MLVVCFCSLCPSPCSMAKSFKKNYVLADTASSSAWQLLCTWDFTITNERAVRQRKNNLCVQLKVNVIVCQSHYCQSRKMYFKLYSQFSFSLFLTVMFGLVLSLQESLSEKAQREMLTLSEKLKHFGIHLGSWLLSTSLAFGCGISIYYLCQHEQEVLRGENVA